MNILFLDQYGGLGGAQRCLLDLLPAIIERGWRAQLLIPEDGPFAQAARETGAAVDFIRIGPFHSWSKRPGDFLRYASQTPQLLRTIARFDPRVVYVNGPRLVPPAAVAMHGKAALVFHAHSYLAKGYAVRAIGLALRARKATVIAACRFVAQPWTRYVTPHVIYNGVGEIPYRSRSCALRIGVVGRIAPEKGQAEFVEAARIVLARFPRCRFLICGAPVFSDSSYSVHVRELARDLPIEFLGWRDDIDAVLAELDLLAVPSASHDATPRVIPEAYSAGLPVVAFRSGGIVELVEDGKTGYLSAPSTAEALAERMCAVLSEAEERRRTVAEAARAAWESRFTLPQYRKQVIEILEPFA